MNRYLTIHIPETAVPMPVSRFLHTQAGLTKKQISQAKFRPGGIKKNGQQCRVTETAYPGDQIMVCLETDDVDSAQLESATFTVNSDRYKSCFHHSTDSTFCSYSTSDACCLSASPFRAVHPAYIPYFSVQAVLRWTVQHIPCQPLLSLSVFPSFHLFYNIYMEP